jgi:TRAP-type transport system periplasmic protein
MKIVAPAVFGILLCIAPVFAQQPKYKIHWLLGHPNLDYFEEAAASFKTIVENGSRGEIAVHIATTRDAATSSGLGQTGSEIADAVSGGEAQMGHSFTDVMGNVDHRLWAFEAPYLMRDSRHMEGVIEGPLGAELLDGLSQRHLVGLALTYSGGPQGVATVGREIRRPEDLKGLKVGVYGDPIDAAWLETLGAIPVAIEHRLESIEGLVREGKLDGVVTTWRNIERVDLDRDFKYFNLPGSTFLVSVTYVNEKFFMSLPPEYRELLRRASRETARIERVKTIELNETAKRRMLAKGMRPVHLAEAGRKQFTDALRPAYERSIDAILGRGLVDRVRRTADGPALPTVPEGFAHHWPIGP